MARFGAELPNDLIKELEKINRDTDKIMGKMTEAGAKVVEQNVKANAPAELSSHVKVSKTYKTPSDGAINNKVYFNGYLPFSGGRTSFTRKGGSGKAYATSKGVPAEFVAMVTEYGTSERYTESGENRGKIAKKPFFRKSFKRAQIEEAMLEAQKQASGGLLE